MSLVSAGNQSKEAATGTAAPGWQVAQHRVWAEGGPGGRGPANHSKLWKAVEIVPCSYGTQQRLSARKSHNVFYNHFQKLLLTVSKIYLFLYFYIPWPLGFLSRPLSSPLHSHRVTVHALFLFLPCHFSGFCLLLSLPCSDSSSIPLIVHEVQAVATTCLHASLLGKGLGHAWGLISLIWASGQGSLPGNKSWCMDGILIGNKEKSESTKSYNICWSQCETWLERYCHGEGIHILVEATWSHFFSRANTMSTGS